MGANIGTTVTAQILAFDLTNLLPAIVYRHCHDYVCKKQGVAEDRADCGGLLHSVYGHDVQVGVNGGPAEWEPFIDILLLESPVIGISAGTAITALCEAKAAQRWRCCDVGANEPHFSRQFHV